MTGSRQQELYQLVSPSSSCNLDDDLAEMRRRAEIPISAGCVVEGEAAVDHRLDLVGDDRTVHPFEHFARSDHQPAHDHAQIGRASCRESVCQYVLLPVVAVSYKQNKTITIINILRKQ